MATIEAVARMRDELSSKLEKIYGLSQQTESGVSSLEDAITKLGENQGTTRLAARVSVDMGIIRAELEATQIQALKTAAALDALGGAGGAPLAASAASGLILPGGGRAASNAAAVASAAAASSGAASATRPAFAPPGGTSPTSLTRDFGAIRSWDEAHPTFWSAPGVFPSRPDMAWSAPGIFGAGRPAAPNMAETAAAAAAAVAAAREARGAGGLGPTGAASEAWQRIAASRAPLQAPQGTYMERKAAAFIAEMASKGRTGSELGPGQYAFTAPYKHAYYEQAGYTPAMAPDNVLRLYGPGGEPGTTNFGVAPGAGGGGGGGSGGFWGSLFGSAAGGGGGGGIGSKLLWGGGGAFGIGAGFGSIASFAGLGFEHAVLTTGGILGSAIGGLGGAGLVGLGALGQIGVGAGADIGVSTSAIADTQALYKGFESVQEAKAKFGSHSKQAREAEKELHFLMNHTLGGTRGVKAELGLAEGLSSLNKAWDKKTGPARGEFAKIGQQGLGVAEAFLPKVAHFADMNLTIINRDLKPLFSWLKGPEAMGIFDNLERKFKSTLPTAMHAFDQGIEFLAKTINALQKYTGGFVKELDKILTYANSPEGFHKWEGFMGHLVEDFHAWWNLIKVVGRDLYDLFSQDAHTGRGIVEEITKMLEKLGEWERSVAGKGEIHNIFVIHREEVEEILKVLPPLLTAFSKIYLVVAPPLVKALTTIAGAFATVLEALNKVPGGAWVIGLTLVARQLGILMPLLKGVRGAMAGTLGQSVLAGGAAAGGTAAGNAIVPVGEAGVGGLAILPGEGYGSALAAGGLGAVAETAANKYVPMLARAAAPAAAGYFAGEVGKQIVGGKIGGLISNIGTYGGIGAGIGSFFPMLGGPVTGGLIGGAVGAGITAIDALNQGGRSAPSRTLRSQIGQEARVASAGWARYSASLQGVEEAEKHLDVTNERHKAATERVIKAHRELNRVIAEFGPASQQAYEAELHLADAQHKDAVTAHQAAIAHHLKGASLQLFKLEAEEEVGREEGRLPALDRLKHHLEVRTKEEPDQRGILKNLVKVGKEIIAAEAKVEQTIEHAGGIAGKGFQKRLHQIVKNAEDEAEVLKKIAGPKMKEAAEKLNESFAETLTNHRSRSQVAEGSKSWINALMLGNSPGGIASQETLTAVMQAGHSLSQQFAEGMESRRGAVANAAKILIRAAFGQLNNIPGSESRPHHEGASRSSGTGRSAKGHRRGGRIGFAGGGRAGTATGAFLAGQAEGGGLEGAILSSLESRLSPKSLTGMGGGLVSWAEHNIGAGKSKIAGWDAEGGYPYGSQWCGIFLGADMRAHGITPPSGYGAAANWAKWGTPVSASAMTAGDIIDYDGHHVALYIGGGRQIQGNDADGTVGISGIGSSLGLGPITAIRKPPGGRTSFAGGGRVPGVYTPADNVPAMLSPEEFVVTGPGEHMLERMTGVPRVLDHLERMQGAHFAEGGRAGSTSTALPAVSAGGPQVSLTFTGDFYLNDEKQLEKFFDELRRTLEDALRNRPENASEPTFVTV